jgi:ornithine cyclodeaminase/alanine dehydrogenase-like protein (mu-crystallin family)
VLDVERAWANAGLGQGALPVLETPGLIAATCAIASRFLAVGTPRTIGLVGEPLFTERCLEGHRAYFAEPPEIRQAELVGLKAACAADIVCVFDDAARIDPIWLRNGTHVNLARGALTGPAPRAMMIDTAALAQIVCGHRDGRQLDELTIFTIA